MGRVLLVRHAETTWNREGRVQGWAPTPLTTEGRSQARAAGRALAAGYDVDRFVSSDLRRTVETVRELRRPVDAPVSYDRRWRERDFGVLQGLTREELYEGNPEFSLLEAPREGARARPERGESWLDVRERVLTAWESLRTDLDGETVAVATHGGPVRIVLADVFGLDVRESVTELSVDNLSVTELSVDPAADGAEVVRRTEPLAA